MRKSLLLLMAAAAWGETSLPYRVVDAGFSTAVDRLVLLGAEPAAVHYLDPVTGGDRAVALPALGSELELGADGTATVRLVDGRSCLVGAVAQCGEPAGGGGRRGVRRGMDEARGSGLVATIAGDQILMMDGGTLQARARLALDGTGRWVIFDGKGTRVHAVVEGATGFSVATFDTGVRAATAAGSERAAVPTVLAGVPPAGGVARQTLSVLARDADGRDNLSRIYFRLGATEAVTRNGCHGFYDRASNGLYLYDDTLTVLQGPMTPGGAGVLENGQCRIEAAGSSTGGAGTDLLLNLRVELLGSYLTGTQSVYSWVTDREANGTGWVFHFTWTVTPLVDRPPVLVSTFPGVATGAAQRFSVNLADPDGANQISRVYFLVSATPDVATGGCHGFYDRPSNSLYLYDDALRVLEGPLQAGTNGSLRNGQCQVNGTGSGIVIEAGTALGATLDMQLLGSFTTGVRNLYFWVKDRAGNDSGWMKGASWQGLANVAPVVVSGLPYSVPNPGQIQFTVRDANGADDVQRVYFLVESGQSVFPDTCHGFFDWRSNSFYLYSDGLRQLQGPVAVGSGGELRNTQCTVRVNSFTWLVSRTGNDLVFAMDIQLNGGYALTPKMVSLWAVDRAGAGTGWQDTGVMNRGGSGLPRVTSVSPANPVAASELFTVTIEDGDTYRDLQRVYFLLESGPGVQQNGCHGYYDLKARAVYLYNDGLTALQGPLGEGTAGTVENGQCAIEGPSVTSSGSYLTLTLQMRIRLKGSFLAGTRTLWFWPVDAISVGTAGGWQAGATWVAGAPQPWSVSGTAPATATGTSQAFSMVLRAPEGSSAISRVYFILNSSPTIVPNGCFGWYERATNKVYVYDDSLTQLVIRGVTPGAAETSANSQCGLDGATTSVTYTATDLLLTIGFRRLGGFANQTQNLYWAGSDISKRNVTGWVPGGTWAP